MFKQIVVVIILMLIAVALYAGINTYNQPKFSACTQEAKLCADGSAVGRVGPNCEFAKCPAESDEVNSFNECIVAGNLVMESYPRQCKTGDGKLFVEYIGNEIEKVDLIRLHTPRPNTIITSPLQITGEARGVWFFEASFPIALTDWDGRIISQHYIMTADEWMTENFVSFRGFLEFESPYNFGDPEFMKRGTLILQKDNPSGLPEHDDALEIPILFR
jgi:hypothetical protein